MDLVLHLPMRYEDETEIVAIREACLRGGHASQVEGVVVKNEIRYRPRRQLLVTFADATGELLLRFMNFYGSQVKQLAEGTRVRARGEVRHGFFGAEMVHPAYKIVNEGAPLPNALTPVYPAGEGLSQTVLRRAIADAMKRVDWTDTLPQPLRARCSWPIRAGRAAAALPAAGRRSARAGRALPSGVDADEVRRAAGAAAVAEARAAGAPRKGAPRLAAVGPLSDAFSPALPFQLTGAQQRVLREIRADLRRALSDAAPAAGRRRQRQDRGRGAGGRPGDRQRLSGRADGADRNPRRAALPQDRGVDGAAGRARWPG